MRAKYGKATRDYFLKKTAIKQLIDFGDSPIFEAATTYTNILIFEKGISKKEPHVWDLSRVYQKELFLDTMIQNSTPSIAILSPESFLIMPKHLTEIKNQIEEVGVPLKDWDISIYRGVLTGFNEAFILSKEKRDALIAADPKSAEILKPVLRGKDIKRYQVEFADIWLINSHNGYFDKKNNSRVEAVNIDLYPAVKAHLDEYWKTIEKRYDKGKTPYNLRNCAYITEFEDEKIVYSEIVYDSAFCFDSKGFLGEATLFVLTGESLKFLISMLNSRLLTFAFRYFYSGGDLRGNTFRYKKVFLENLPVAKLLDQKQRPFEVLVDLILHAKLNSHEPDTANFEAIIDGLVFQLYFLEHMQEKQIDILHFVEKDLAEVMQNQDFDKLPDNEKEEIIEELHARWTHPDSEVRNRIKLFAVRSPDILKPILESS